MNSATSTQSVNSTSIPSAILPSEATFQRATAAVENLPSALGPRRTGYGLPCVKCKTYYAADLAMCPVCKTEERVSPMLAASAGASLPESALPVPDEAAWKKNASAFCASSSPRFMQPMCKSIQPKLLRLGVWAAAWKKTIRADRSQPRYASIATSACRSGLTCWKRPCTWIWWKPHGWFTKQFGRTRRIRVRRIRMQRAPF